MYLMAMKRVIIHLDEMLKTPLKVFHQFVICHSISRSKNGRNTLHAPNASREVNKKHSAQSYIYLTRDAVKIIYFSGQTTTHRKRKAKQQKESSLSYKSFN